VQKFPFLEGTPLRSPRRRFVGCKGKRSGPTLKRVATSWLCSKRSAASSCRCWGLGSNGTETAV